MKFKTLYEKQWTGRQSQDFQALYQSNGKNLGMETYDKIRITIHADTSFAFQSHAIAEVFSGANRKWNEIASLPYPEITKQSQYEKPDFTKDVENLKQMVAATLDL